MIKRLSILVVVVGILAAFSDASPQLCQETTINYSSSLSNYTMIISADLKLSLQNSKNLVSISNITVKIEKQIETDVQLTLNGICAESLGGSRVCNGGNDQPFTVPLGDNVIVLEANLTLTLTSPQNTSTFFSAFYAGVVDQQGFSFYDGRLYDENNTCFNYGYQDDNIDLNLSECCTSMTPINITTLNTPACTKFSSISTIQNTNDNSSYANITFNYEIQNNNFTMIGRFSGPVGYLPIVIIDDAEGCNEILNGTIYCGYPLYSTGSKLLMFLSDSSILQTSPPAITPPAALMNRIIIRDGQTFMDNTTPFTSANACMPFTSPYGSTKTAYTTLCCTEFQADNSASSSSSMSTISSTSVSSTTTKTSGAQATMSFNFSATVMALVALLMMKKI